MSIIGRIVVIVVVLGTLTTCQGGETLPAPQSSTAEHATAQPSATDLPTCTPTVDASTAAAMGTKEAETPTSEGYSSGRIAFISKMGGHTDLWWVHSDGTNLERLTNNTQAEWGARWSPDGNRIAYATWTAAYEGSIWILDVRSKQGLPVTDPDSDTVSVPSWSPDGRTIAYSTWITDVPHLWLIHVETGDQTELAQYAGMPVWSPDGKKLATVAPPAELEPGPARLVPFFSIITVEGKPFDHLHWGWIWRKHVTGRAWSRAGDRLLVTSEAGGPASPGFASLEIVEVRDRTASIMVKHEMKCNDQDCDFYAPSWFPGDKEILFIAAVPLPPRAPYDTPEPDEPEGRWWLYKAADDLSSIQVVFESALPISDAALSPDGMKVVFVQGEYSDAELLIFDLGTGETMQLTNNDVYDGEPVWQPQP